MDETEKQNHLITVRDHITRHRGKYCYLAGIITMHAINRTAINSWNEFLAAEDLTDKFYAPED